MYNVQYACQRKIWDGCPSGNPRCIILKFYFSHLQNYLPLSSCYTPLAVVSRTRKTLRVSTTATDSTNSGCFVERGRCDRRYPRHAKIRGHHSHMNNCRINEISIKLKQ
jgi:hypothetical protein